jgi:hypothetical protein
VKPDVEDNDTQTDPIPEPEPIEVEKVIVKEVFVERPIERTNVQRTHIHPVPAKPSRRQAFLIETANYSEPADEEAIKAIPSLHCVVMPFMSTMYVPPVPADTKVLNQMSAQQVGAARKPVLWALQLIHNFFCDPFLRSLENIGKNTIETIALDWINRQLKIAHLITQAVNNISYAITEYRHQHGLIDLFADMIDGTFSLSQVCFIATAYAFSCRLAVPNLIDILQKTDIDPAQLTVKIHIRIAHALLTKCFSEDISGDFLGPKLDPEQPLLNYIAFLREVGVYFGAKHKMIYYQAKELLFLSGSLDYQVVVYKHFEHFMIFLGNDGHIKEDWKNLVKNSESTEATVTFSELLTSCAERREILLELVNLVPLHGAAKTLAKIPQHLKDLHGELIVKFARIVTQILAKWQKIPDRIVEIRYHLRQALLTVDIERAVWFFRLLVTKIDRTIMKRKGCIPFNSGATPEMVAQLTEYIDRTESVAFALLED